MVCASSKKLGKDDSGAVFLEFTIAGGFFLFFIFGATEFSNIFYQWNLATEATQLGARLAAVSEPVATKLTTVSADVINPPSVLPGDPMPAFDYQCQATGPSAGSCTNSGNYNAAAMDAIFFGRGDANKLCTTDTAVDPQFTPLKMGMCDVFDRMVLTNVIVRYRNAGGTTGLGYAGRPGRAVSTISVEITGMTYTYVLLNGLFGLSSVNLPSFRSTITGEDLNMTGT